MKRNKLAPSSTGTDFVRYLYACKYHPSATQFKNIPLDRYKLQDSTLRSIICQTEVIDDLAGYKLNSGIECFLSEDEDGSIVAECPDLRVYSSGNTRQEAIANIKENIISLYEDLCENDDFSDDWLEIKRNLKRTITQL